MVHPNEIEAAVRRVGDQASFIQELLIDALQWPIDLAATEVEEITYAWTSDELRADDLDKTLVDGTIRQIQPFPGNPWGIFLLEFRNPDVFTTNRGMTGTLRRVLRGLVPSKRRDSNLASFQRENLLFICNHNYEHFRFAHFKAPKKSKQVEPLAAFGWGPGDPIRTLCEFNLKALAWPAVESQGQWLETWSDAFNVEKVTQLFYRDYAAVFSNAEKLIEQTTTLEGDRLRMFTQTLFNRLMFVRFIERKRWLTFKGSNHYLQALFSAGGMKDKSFFTSRLHPLFFEGLAIKGKQSSSAYGDVPFLNGGLFEATDLDSEVKDLPNSVFQPILADDGLFYRYNFTVEESTPLEIEVAVDPEMLGKVFEELVTGRHESGSYYTPRPIVSFMCREAIKGVLAEKTSASATAIASLVDEHQIGRLSQAKAKEILVALQSLKAVDPACGSGAYLLGLLHELIAIYSELFNTQLSADAKSLYELKLDIITRNIYGVDIDPFATNIAKLRLWLSLAVEATDPLPLPNLDFKIETGDSLLAPNPQEAPDLFRAQLQIAANVLAIQKRQFVMAHGDEKEDLRQQIVTKETELKSSLEEHYGDDVVDWRIAFAEVFGFGNRGFDIVVANPPYVRQELITEFKPTYQRNFPSVYAGAADLYVYFYARGIELLHQKGMLAFIAPNKFFRAGYGKKLRKFLANRTCVQTVIDFADYPIFQAITYPSIIVTRQGKCRIGDETFSGLNWDSSWSADEIRTVVANQSSHLSRANISEDGWRIVDSNSSHVMTKIRKVGMPLSSVCTLYYGIKTGCNDAFEIDEATRAKLVQSDPKSSDLIRPWLRGQNVGRWDIEWKGKYLLFTRRGVQIDIYPAIKAYLEKQRKRLEPRPAGVSTNNWSGRKPGSYKWYEIQDAIDYWQRFDEPKIIYQEIATYQQFAYTEASFVSNDKTWFIPSPPKGLIGILNSKLAWFFLDQIAPKLQGGAFELRSPYVSQLPIIPPTKDIITRVDKILKLDRSTIDGMAATRQLEREIDEIVLKLYGLDKSDEKIIDEALAKADNRFPRDFRQSPEYQQYVAETFG